MFGVAHHSSKRRAEEELEGEQPITKRLARMRIGEATKKAPQEEDSDRVT